MSHSRNSRAIRDLRDSRPGQSEIDREATDIACAIGDSDITESEASAIVQEYIDNAPTARHHIVSMDQRLAELVEAHDAVAPLYPEFGPRAANDNYSLDDYRAGLDVTRTDLPALPAREPSWREVLRMGIVDAIKEVL
jgi:hypothetical protein